MIDRRNLLAGGAAASLALLHPGAMAEGRESTLALPWRSLPDTGMPRRPLALVEGRPPEDFAGTYLLNGPAKYERAGYRYGHWFDGDGMMNRFRFGPGEATHEARFIETRKFREERAAGRFLYPSFASVPPDARPVTGPDDMNVANIAVIERGGEVWALWEGGSPTRVFFDGPAADESVALGDGLEGVPFSAHPRIDRHGTLWGYGYAALSGHLILYEVAPDGTLRRFKLLDGFPLAMVHDFIATERHLIVGIPPLRVVRRGAAYLDHFAWQPDEPRLYVVIDKADFSVVRRHELPGAFVFHHFGGWEDESGAIHFAACAYRDASWMQVEAKAIMQGVAFTGTREAIFERIALLPDGRFTVESDGRPAEFPVFDPRRAEARGRQWSISRSSGRRDFGNCLHARDDDGSVVDEWTSSRDIMMGEHVPVTRAGGGTYLIGPHFDFGRGATRIALFNGDSLSSGPLAIWETPEPIPAALHGTWLAG